MLGVFNDGVLKRYFIMILKYDLVWTSSNKNARNRDYREKKEPKQIRIKTVTKKKQERNKNKTGIRVYRKAVTDIRVNIQTRIKNKEEKEWM